MKYCEKGEKKSLPQSVSLTGRIVTASTTPPSRLSAVTRQIVKQVQHNQTGKSPEE